MFFLGVGADSCCDYRLNVHFVQFIWDNFERFSIRKFAIIILPSDNVPAPLNLSVALPSSTRLLYLKYYRAFSDSLWMNRQICGECIIKNCLSLKFLCGFRRPEGVCSYINIRDNLPPYVTYVRTYISETYDILNSPHSRPLISK